MTTVISNDVHNPPAVALLTRKDPDMPPAIPAGLPPAAHPVGLRQDDRAQPRLLLHIAGQAGGQIPAGLPTNYLCGAPVRLLLGAIAPGDGPDGPGVCPICAALDHRGRLPGQTRDTTTSQAASPAAARPGQAARPAGTAPGGQPGGCSPRGGTSVPKGQDMIRRVVPASSPKEDAGAKTPHLRGFACLDGEPRLGYQQLP